MKRIYTAVTVCSILLYLISSLEGSSFAANQNVCILYTQNMNYYCEWEASEILCNNYVGKKYAGQKVIQVWFYYERYCREFGFKSFSN